MLQWIGLVCVLLMGAALGASMCGPPAAVTPMAAVAPAPPPAAPRAGPPAASGAPKAATPPTREERVVGLQLQEQEERTFHWERGWLRLEQVELHPDKTRVELTVFLQEGAADVFYVEVEGTLLVAGPWSGRATRSTFPSFAADRPHIKGYGVFYYFGDIVRDAQQRVSPGREWRYTLEFPAIAVVPEVLDLKVRFLHLKDAASQPLQFVNGHVSGPELRLASCRWDAGLRREIAALLAQLGVGKAPAPPETTVEKKEATPAPARDEATEKTTRPDHSEQTGIIR